MFPISIVGVLCTTAESLAQSSTFLVLLILSLCFHPYYLFFCWSFGSVFLSLVSMFYLVVVVTCCCLQPFQT